MSFKAEDAMGYAKKLFSQPVTPEKTTFIKKSTNLFNKETVNVGFNISSADGSLVSNGSYNTTDYIPVNPMTEYSYYGFLNVAYYDKNKAFLSRPIVSPTGATKTTPSNAHFIRVHYQPGASYSNRQINKSSSLLPFEEYYERLEKISLSDNVVKTRNIENASITNEKMGLLSIGSDNLKGKAVTKEKTDFIESNTNLFNHNTIEEKVVILSDGTITSNNGYSISDFILVTPDSTYSSYGFVNIARYDQNKNFIDRLAFNSTTEHKVFSTTNNTYFIRLNFQGGAAVGERRINEGSELLPFEFHDKVFAGVGLSQYQIERVKADNEISKLLNENDKIMFDLPINDVFSTSDTYSEYGDFTNTTAAQVYQMYDDLMTQYPEYITKEFLGNDAWGNPISLYKFTPAKPSASVSTRYPKVFLTSGTHGYEHVPGLVTYLMFKDICERWQDNPLLETLRFNVDFLVIPVVNPSGWDDYTRKNRNGVDINRNFPEDWDIQNSDPTSQVYRGDSPLSELESQYVSSVFDNNPDIDIMYDFHNFSGSETTDYFIWIPTTSGSFVQHMAQILISRMTRKWRKEYSFIPDADWFAGYTDATAGAMIQDHAKGRGIKAAATFEVCGRWWIEPAASTNDLPYNTTHKVTSVEAFVNWLLINLNEISK